MKSDTLHINYRLETEVGRVFHHHCVQEHGSIYVAVNSLWNTTKEDLKYVFIKMQQNF